MVKRVYYSNATFIDKNHFFVKNDTIGIVK